MLPNAAFLVAILAQPTPASEPPPAADPPTAWTDLDRLTGDWGGARTALEERGLTIGAEYTAEFTSVLSGGVNTRGSFRDLLTIDATLDTEAAFGLPGGTAFIQYLTVDADDGGSTDAGDIQLFSNLENDRSIDAIYELWYEQSLANGRLRLKLGKFDANSDFHAIDYAGSFAHSSAGFSPTIVGFPSYPNSATGLAIALRPTESIEFSYGFFDGASGPDAIRTGTSGPATFFSDDRSDDYFHIFEASLDWAGEETLGRGRLTLGATYHTGRFDRFEGGTETGALSVYAIVEQSILRRDEGEPGGLHAFAQVGLADDSVSEIGAHLAAGLVAEGPIAQRPTDSAGVYVSYADLSDATGAGFPDDEVAIDLYYRAQLTGFAFIQPQIQYIVSPSGNPSVENAVVAGLRIGVSF